MQTYSDFTDSSCTCQQNDRNQLR